MRRTLHLCLSVRGALRWDKRMMARQAKAARHADGRVLTGEELREHLMDELAQGHEVIPLGAPCEGFDYETGCPGHDEPEAS